MRSDVEREGHVESEDNNNDGPTSRAFLFFWTSNHLPHRDSCLTRNQDGRSEDCVTSRASRLKPLLSAESVLYY